MRRAHADHGHRQREAEFSHVIEELYQHLGQCELAADALRSDPGPGSREVAP